MIYLLVTVCGLLVGYFFGFYQGTRFQEGHTAGKKLKQSIGTCRGCGSGIMMKVSDKPEWWQCATIGCGLAGEGEEKPEWLS